MNLKRLHTAGAWKASKHQNLKAETVQKTSFWWLIAFFQYQKRMKIILSFGTTEEIIHSKQVLQWSLFSKQDLFLWKWLDLDLLDRSLKNPETFCGFSFLPLYSGDANGHLIVKSLFLLPDWLKCFKIEKYKDLIIFLFPKYLLACKYMSLYVK